MRLKTEDWRLETEENKNTGTPEQHKLRGLCFAGPRGAGSGRNMVDLRGVAVV